MIDDILEDLSQLKKKNEENIKSCDENQKKLENSNKTELDSMNKNSIIIDFHKFFCWISYMDVYLSHKKI